MDDRLRSDAELIVGSLDDPEAFGLVFERHFDAVFRFALRRVGRGEAGDVAAEVFVRAFRIRDRYDLSRGDCRPWLYGIASNVAGDRLRRRRRRGGAGLPVDRLVEVWSDVDDRLVAESSRGMINRGLGALSAEDRETFLLFAVESLSYGEISLVLGVPVGTVGSRISRARRVIREEVPELGQTTDRMSGGESDTGTVS